MGIVEKVQTLYMAYLRVDSAIVAPGGWPPFDLQIRLWVAHPFLQFVQKGWGWFSLASALVLFDRKTKVK